MRKEDMCLYGTVFKLILASFTEGKEFLHLSLMRVWFRQVTNMLGYGLQLNQFTNRSILGIHSSKERNMFVSKNFIHSLVSKYGKHTI
jgi:hypothetical protein